MKKSAMVAAVCAAFGLALFAAGCNNSSDSLPYIPRIRPESPATTYTVSVTNGTANPTSAAAGETVTITANAPETDKVFDKWTTATAGVTFTDESASTTTFKMPASNVAVTATYMDMVDLSKITENTVVQDKFAIIGTLGGKYKISIADGATVILRDVSIPGADESACNWAGITCAGNATIILEGTNEVTGFYGACAGIYVQSGKTLTIKGTGSLTVRSNGSGAGIGGDSNSYFGNIVIESGVINAFGGSAAPGIGGRKSGGNITIKGGTVTASGGQYAAGIGAGDTDSTCGDISITGGTVIATGGENAAAIGCGRTYSARGDSRCGAITIANTVTKVEVTKGEGSPCSIGLGKDGLPRCCKTITIGGTVYWDGSDYKNDGGTLLAESHYTYQP